MYCVHARYRGRADDRTGLVAASARALARLDGVDSIDVVGDDALSADARTSVGATTLVMALLAAGEWTAGIGISPVGDGRAARVAAAGVMRAARGPVVRTRIRSDDPAAAELADDVSAAFTLLHHVISRRSPEGREATNLMRAGWTQVEAAEDLGISKQAVNQRLAAAGWHAEEAGWSLAVHLLDRALTM
ncbi:DNA-binding protein [Corynebacterium sp.]|uniref:DNA-binding protein n=1 Tax=Corynebacterium sp. TaxID=1720 RepID=UPI0026DB1789|nr:DNA-binding protein [Corynebacterium sp.]MDO4609364.1 DNA-binding protein [Corynebacterium sp.]